MASQRHNILFIHTDQQRADTMACYGNTVIKTPHLDQLAMEGTLFENAHCTYPKCMPSRATLLTGRYAQAHKLYRNGIPLDPNQPFISDILHHSGYRTGLIGKAHFTPLHGDPEQHPESVQLNNGIPPEQCWEYWDNFNGPYYGFDDVRLSLGHGDTGMLGGHYGKWIHREHADSLKLFSQSAALEPSDLKYRSWKSAVPLDLHSATWTTNQTMDFIRQRKDSPFYAWVGFQEPHVPFNPPKPYCDLYRPEDMPAPITRKDLWRDNPPYHIHHYLNKREAWASIDDHKAKEVISHYYANITLVDDCVGRMIDCLKEEGLYDNTVIVFTSDHGEWLGDHGLWLKGAVHTHGLTRVPLVIRWPGISKSGHRVKSVSSLVDIVPTLLDAANAEIPYGVQGRSLRSVLTGEINTLRPYAYIEHRHEPHNISTQFQTENEIINKSENDFYMKTIVTDDYRLSHFPNSAYGELFDLRADPDEQHNLWKKEPELRKNLQLYLLDVLIETQDPLPLRQWGW